MTRIRPFLLGLSLGLGTTSVSAGTALAAQLRIDKVDKAPVLDGVPGEWDRELGKLGVNVKGSPSATDLAAKAAISYDDKNLYVAVDVADDTLVGGGEGDRVDLVIAVGNTIQTVSLFPGQPGKVAGKATTKGQSITGAKVVEAPKKGGWSLEASVPWSAFDATATTRVGMKGGVFVFDSDSGASVDAAVGTASGTDTASLGGLLTTPEQELTDGLMRDKKLGAPSFQFVANVVGDSMKERVLVFGQYLVVLGPTFRNGKEYYFNDMSVGGGSMSVTSLVVKDLDGDGRDEIIFTKRFTKTGQKTARDVLQVHTFGSGDVPELVFRHEVGISNAKGSITNDVKIGAEGGKATLLITPGSAKGLDEKSYDEPTETSYDPVLLPWGTIESHTIKGKGKTYTKAEKTRSKPGGAEPANTKPAATTGKVSPAPTKTDPPKPDVNKVLAQYKKDRGISASAKQDLSGDVAEDGQVERVLLHDKELVVLGPGFKSGSSYVFTTLPFASASDIKSVSLREVTGDKKSEVVVRGILKAKGPKKEEVEREVELVFKVASDGIKRVFGAELGRTIGANKIVGSISYDGGKITLASGKATGFTKENYPFSQDTSAVGGFEPLLLPWSDTKQLKYKWSGSGFDKQ